MPNGDCPIGAEMKAKVQNVEREQKDLWSAIDGLRTRLDRLPAWATVLLMVLMGVIGMLGTLVAT